MPRRITKWGVVGATLVALAAAPACGAAAGAENDGGAAEVTTPTPPDPQLLLTFDDQPRVVVGEAEQALAASVAGEQQRPFGVAAGQQGPQVLVGARRVTQVELDGGADLGRGPDHDADFLLGCPGHLQAGDRRAAEVGAPDEVREPIGLAILEAPHVDDVRVLPDMVLEDFLAAREAIGARRRHKTFRLVNSVQGAGTVREANGERAPANHRRLATREISP